MRRRLREVVGWRAASGRALSRTVRLVVPPTPTPAQIIEGYLRPMRALDWDRGTLEVYRAFQVGRRMGFHGGH